VKRTFAGVVLTGVWPEHCPNGHALAWAEMAENHPEASCQYAACAGPTWRQWHELSAPVVRPARGRRFRVLGVVEVEVEGAADKEAAGRVARERYGMDVRHIEEAKEGNGHGQD